MGIRLSEEREIMKKADYINSMKETPAGSLEFLIKKMNVIPDQIRNAQTAQETEELLETLKYIRTYFLKDIIEDLERTKSVQSVSLPAEIDLDRITWIS